MIGSWSQSESYFAAETASRRFLLCNYQTYRKWAVICFRLSDRGSPDCDCPSPPTLPLPVTNAAFQRCLECLSPTWCPALFRHSVRHRLCHNPSLGVTYVCVSACVCFLSFGSAFGEDEKCESCMKNQALPGPFGYQEPNPNTQLQTANRSSSI